MGIIPGSMGTKSYIVRGLGNAASFESASHGAGRRMREGLSGSAGSSAASQLFPRTPVVGDEVAIG
jgi:hypothetical protein